MAAVPRPRLDVGKKKVDAIQVRLSASERDVFDRLSADVGAHELRGVAMTDAGMLRWLFLTAAEERGIVPSRASASKPRKKSTTPKGKAKG